MTDVLPTHREARIRKWLDAVGKPEVLAIIEESRADYRWWALPTPAELETSRNQPPPESKRPATATSLDPDDAKDRVCVACTKTLPASKFYKATKDRRHNICKRCWKERYRS